MLYDYAAGCCRRPLPLLLLMIRCTFTPLEVAAWPLPIAITLLMLLFADSARRLMPLPPLAASTIIARYLKARGFHAAVFLLMRAAYCYALPLRQAQHQRVAHAAGSVRCA